MNTFNVQDIIDGPRNGVFKVDLALDSSDLTNQVVWDPALHYADPIYRTNSCAIFEIQYAVQNGLSVQFLWDAPVPQSIIHLEGRGKFPLDIFSGIPNNAGNGTSGKILMNTYGWTVGAVLAGSFIFHVTKTVI